jgi:RHS repeat-associated protein
VRKSNPTPRRLLASLQTCLWAVFALCLGNAWGMRTIDPLDLPKAERQILSESAEDAGYYFNARWYSPERGSFTGRDIAEQFWTPYSYVGNGPLTGIDPTGTLQMLNEGSNGDLSFESYDPDTYGQGLIFNGHGADAGQYLSNVDMANPFSVFSGSQGSGSPMVTGNMSLIDPSSGMIMAFPAWSGSQSGYQPIVPGSYLLFGDDHQTYESISISQKALGLIAKGTWRGGTFSWGSDRSELVPFPSTAQAIKDAGRTGHFFVHGGDVPGSRGCIDLLHNEQAYLNSIPNSPHLVFVPQFRKQ